MREDTTPTINEEALAKYEAKVKPGDVCESVTNAACVIDYLIETCANSEPDELKGVFHIVRLMAIDLRRQSIGADPLIRNWVLRLSSALDFLFETEADQEDYFSAAQHFPGFLITLNMIRDDLLELYDIHFSPQVN